MSGLATGAGAFAIGEVVIQFRFNGVQFADGSAGGSFRHRADLGEGEFIAFESRVTCLALDSENGRAWFGGEIVANHSTPGSGFTGELHQPGRDIWFRVLDTGVGSPDPDRSTFVGFEGSAGIGTSEEYCQIRIWPDGNARTNALTHGAITIATH